MSTTASSATFRLRLQTASFFAELFTGNAAFIEAQLLAFWRQLQENPNQTGPLARMAKAESMSAKPHCLVLGHESLRLEVAALAEQENGFLEALWLRLLENSTRSSTVVTSDVSPVESLQDSVEPLLEEGALEEHLFEVPEEAASAGLPPSRPIERLKQAEPGWRATLPEEEAQEIETGMAEPLPEPMATMEQETHPAVALETEPPVVVQEADGLEPIALELTVPQQKRATKSNPMSVLTKASQ